MDWKLPEGNKHTTTYVYQPCIYVKLFIHYNLDFMLFGEKKPVVWHHNATLGNLE